MHIIDNLFAGRKRDMSGFKEAYARSLTRLNSMSQTARSINKSPESLHKKARELAENNQSPGRSPDQSPYRSPESQHHRYRVEPLFKIQPNLLPSIQQMNKTSAFPSRRDSITLQSISSHQETQEDKPQAKTLLGSPKKEKRARLMPPVEFGALMKPTTPVPILARADATKKVVAKDGQALYTNSS